ncbi:uncharacterized protein LOC114752196 [Neltuma alba]|uniref:uncharacterized protein LOC114752196 n=1 Tax=Neltuma alba TaxID=207710 RepID=UPI0010A572CA|nr:uncharacterized protein LOC114752196 [Prosopis alba]
MREAVVSSSEEEDALARSRKKVRTGPDVVAKGRPVVPRVEGWMETVEVMDDEVEEEKRKTYRDACMKEKSLEGVGAQVMDEENEDEWWMNEEGRQSRIKVEQTPKGPNIVLLPEFRATIAKRWCRSLIVTVLGRMVREDALRAKAKQLWGDVEAVDIGAGFFLVTCGNQEVYDRALTGGPWLMYDHYISVQPWKEDFDPDDEVITSVAAWVRISKLPMDYYDTGILHVVGSQIGKVLKIDKNTIGRTKGRFARICVHLDLTKPLQPCVLFNGKEKKVEYEGLHWICFNCGKYGHDSSYCSEGRQRREEEVVATVVDEVGNSSKESPQYGGWMVAQRPWRGKRVGGLDGKGRDQRHEGRDIKSINMGSRFAALEMVPVEKYKVKSPVSIIDTAVTPVLKEKVRGSRKDLIVQKNHEPSVFNKEIVLAPPKTTVDPMEAYLRAKEKLGLNNQVTKDEVGPSKACNVMEVDSEPQSNGLLRAKTPSHGLTEGEHMVKEDDLLDPGALGNDRFLVRSNPLSNVGVGVEHGMHIDNQGESMVGPSLCQ